VPDALLRLAQFPAGLESKQGPEDTPPAQAFWHDGTWVAKRPRDFTLEGLIDKSPARLTVTVLRRPTSHNLCSVEGHVGERHGTGEFVVSRLGGIEVHLTDSSPRGVFTDADRTIVVAHKAELVAALATDGVTPPPATACGFCGTMSWTWTSAWATSGAGTWLCAVCRRRPAPTLIELAATLTPEEHRRLWAEVAAADPLAIQVIGSLMLVTCPSCGGDWWRTAGLDGERCVDCGAWSPCSRPNDAWGAAAR
jgi:hypothetical protein